MSYTKRQIIDLSFEEIGFANYVFDLQPEQYETALRRLDSMMALLSFKGVKTGYPVPTNPQDSDLDDDTYLPDTMVEAVYLNLACRIAPTVGKTVSGETRKEARAGWMNLLTLAAMPDERQFPDTLPAGAGNKPWTTDSPFIRPTEDDVITPPKTDAEFRS